MATLKRLQTMMKLVDTTTGVEIPKGSRRMTFRNEEVIVNGFTPPRHSGSTGRVSVIFLDGKEQEFYPSVISASIIESK